MIGLIQKKLLRPVLRCAGVASEVSRKLSKKSLEMIAQKAGWVSQERFAILEQAIEKMDKKLSEILNKSSQNP